MTQIKRIIFPPTFPRRQLMPWNMPFLLLLTTMPRSFGTCDRGHWFQRCFQPNFYSSD